MQNLFCFEDFNFMKTKRLSLFLIIFAFVNTVFGQSVPTKKELVSHFGFQEFTIKSSPKNIHYYAYQGKKVKKTKLVLYIQGSDPSAQFSYRIKNGKTQKLRWFRNDFKQLSDEYLYVIVEKIGFERVFNEDKIKVPEIYYKENSLDTRVSRTNAVINKLNKKYNFKKIIVYGHSEGAPVAAKLGTVNKSISHLGFWAGNALPDFYDFLMESRKRLAKGEVTDEEAQKQINETIDYFVNTVAKDKNNTKKDDFGYTNKRWWSYSEPPLNNLIKIDIPIFVQVGTQDKSAPIDTTYLIPLEFARLGKKNLTYKICVGCDHGFNIKKSGKTIRKWGEIFKGFIAWTEGNNK